MKNILITAFLFTVTINSFSQALGYQDLGVLFSQNDRNGSARFTAMSGAFGALGGDISSISLNPAGISVFNSSEFIGSFNSRNTDINTNYYGDEINTEAQFFNLSHAGAVLVFDTSYNTEWSKFAIGFNYTITKDFSNNFLAKGNSGIATFRDFPLDNNTQPTDYNVAEEQRFSNNYNGEITEFSVAFSSVHQQKLHVGMALNFYDLNFSQQSQLREYNNDGIGNELDAKIYQENLTTGSGFSANAGFIYKAHSNFRFGFAYQTPTWFREVIESTNITNNDGYFGDTTISVDTDNTSYSNTAGGYYPTQELLYRLKTPSKITASAAFIFGKQGLLSIDYSNKRFKNIRLSNDDFITENQFFKNELRNTHNVHIGAEWRMDRFSVRGGYQLEQDPYSSASENSLKGHSLGAGYNFGNFKIDFSYQNNNSNNQYNFYSGFNVNPAELTTNNRVITSSITFNL